MNIKGLQKQIDGVWVFTIIYGSEDGQQATRYKTNRNSEGLWALTKTGAVTQDDIDSILAWQQVKGVSQFSLIGCTYSAAYNRIIRQFTKDWAEYL